MAVAVRRIRRPVGGERREGLGEREHGVRVIGVGGSGEKEEEEEEECGGGGGERK